MCKKKKPKPVIIDRDPLRFLKLINKGKLVSTLLYQGKSLSLNAFYVGGHFSKRLKIKKVFKDVISILFNRSKTLRHIDKFFVIMYCNNRLDVNNNVGLEKIFSDALKEKGYIVDDNKKFYKGLLIFVDGNIPNNSTEFHLFEV